MKKRIFALVLALAMLLPVLTGCHGAVERHVFEVPEAFDTSKEYELVFGRKMRATSTKRQSTSRPSRILRRCIPTSR